VLKGKDYVVQQIVVGIMVDAPSNFLKYLNVSPKWKQQKKELGCDP
jgi:hypothetical protein